MRSFEKAYNGTQGYMTKDQKAKVFVPEYLKHTSKEGTMDEMNGDVFWTKEIYDAKEEVPLASEDCVEYEFTGKVLLGIWRDDDNGRPMGTISRKQFQSEDIEKTKELASAATSYAGIHQTHQVAKDMMQLETKVDADGTISHVVPKNSLRGRGRQTS